MKVLPRLGVEDVAVPADLVVHSRIAEQTLGERRVRAFVVGGGVVSRLNVTVAIAIHVGVVVGFADRVVRSVGDGLNLIDLGLCDAAVTIPVGHVVMARFPIRIITHALDQRRGTIEDRHGRVLNVREVIPRVVVGAVDIVIRYSSSETALDC